VKVFVGDTSELSDSRPFDLWSKPKGASFGKLIPKNGIEVLEVVSIPLADAIGFLDLKLHAGSPFVDFYSFSFLNHDINIKDFL
tara:strand:+ start:204 stop:455 length:252 start_codon:yes stop_codon:yes gene_type:complete